MERDNEKLKANEKYGLTIVEASEYFGIGQGTIRQLISENPKARFFLKVGNKTVIKRELMKEFLNGINRLN